MRKFIAELIDTQTGQGLGYVTSTFFTVGSRENAKVFRVEDGVDPSDIVSDIFRRFAFCMDAGKHGPLAEIAEGCRLKYFQYLDIEDLHVELIPYTEPQTSLFSETMTEEDQERIAEYYSRHYD